MDDVSALSPGQLLAIQSWLAFYSERYEPVGKWFSRGGHSKGSLPAGRGWEAANAALVDMSTSKDGRDVKLSLVLMLGCGQEPPFFCL